jgi:hypothetical protein
MQQTISLRESVSQQVAETARELQTTPDRLMTQAIEEFLQRHENQRLHQQLNDAYATPPDEDEQELLQASLRLHRQLLAAEGEDSW